MVTLQGLVTATDQKETPHSVRGYSTAVASIGLLFESASPY